MFVDLWLLCHGRWSFCPSENPPLAAAADFLQLKIQCPKSTSPFKGWDWGTAAIKSGVNASARMLAQLFWQRFVGSLSNFSAQETAADRTSSLIPLSHLLTDSRMEQITTDWLRRAQISQLTSHCWRGIACFGCSIPGSFQTPSSLLKWQIDIHQKRSNIFKYSNTTSLLQDTHCHGRCRCTKNDKHK